MAVKANTVANSRLFTEPTEKKQDSAFIWFCVSGHLAKDQSPISILLLVLDPSSWANLALQNAPCCSPPDGHCLVLGR